MSETDSSMRKAGMSAVGETFYGTILDNIKDVPMGKGHGNQGRPLDPDTVCYLKPVFAGIQIPTTRKVVVKAGVKTLKTFTVEASAAYYIPHGIGDGTMYFGTGEAADDHATTRLLAFFKSVPSVAKKLKTLSNRFDDTNGAIKFPDKTFRICPANLTWTQNVNLCFVGICDAFLTERSGMIDQAWDRTTQYPNDKKFIVESQGGEDGFDFDRHYEDTNQGELHVKCPLCGSGHVFNWKSWDMERGGDFVAVPPLVIPSLDHAAWITHHTPILKERKHCGFRRGDESKVLLPDGTYNEQEILKNTHFECYHCGGKWHDDGQFGATRIALDQSSYYVPARPTALPSRLGFNFPKWINRRLPWGEMMLEYLKAKKDKEAWSNYGPLKIWWQKTAARTWSDDLGRDPTKIEIHNHDPSKAIENEHHKGLIIDAQKHLTQDTVGTFWYEVYAADTMGNSFQLDRGFVTSWDELDRIQAKWKIPNRYVVIDGRKWTPVILQQVAARAVWTVGHHRILKKNVGFWETWRVYMGDGVQRHYRWPDKQFRVWSTPQTRYERIIKDGKYVSIPVYIYYWSNLSIKDQLSDLLIGGEGRPKFVALARNQLSPEAQAKEVGDMTYENQMSAEHRTEKNGKAFYEAIRKHNHYWDIACMKLVRMAQEGLAGHVAVTE